MVTLRSVLRDRGTKLPRRRECREGIHEYGRTSVIGGGIARQACKHCGAVTIDLTNTEDGDPFSS